MYIKENILSARDRFAVNRGGLSRGNPVMGGPASDVRLAGLGIDPVTGFIASNAIGKIFGGIFGGPPDPEKLHKKSQKLASKAAELRAAGRTGEADKKLAKSQRKHEKALKFGFQQAVPPPNVAPPPIQVSATVPQMAPSIVSSDFGKPSQSFPQPTQAPIIIGGGGGTAPASAFLPAIGAEAGTPLSIGQQLSNLAIPLSIAGVGLLFLLSQRKRK